MPQIYTMKQSSSFKEKIRNGVLAIGLLAGMCTAALPGTAAAAVTNRPFTTGAKVSSTFDDGLLSSYTQAAPVLAAHGYAGTNYITTGCIGMTAAPNNCPADGDEQYMTWEQVADLQNTYGWEIGAHSVNHPQLATDRISGAITAEQMVAEINNSKTELNTHGFDALNFASPYGDYDNVSVTEIAKQYASHRGFHDTNFNTFPYNEYLLTVQQVRVGVSVDTIKGYIDTAKANGQWLILVFHDVAETPDSDPEEYEYATADLDAIAAYVQQQNLPVTSISGGLAKTSVNLFPNGGFDGGLGTDPATEWTTDSPANVTADANGNGSYPGASNAISMVGGAANAHLFSPTVAINPAEQYVFKNFVNIKSFGPEATVDSEVGFLVDEYDATGSVISSQYTPGIRYSTDATPLYVKNINFLYTPSSANVTKVRLQVIVTANSGIQAYIDNAQLFPVSALTGGGTGEPGPTAKPGDVNGDNAVDALDLSTLLSNWNATSATKSQGELNGDGTIDALDLSILLSNWGK
jgi:peptidoglycan/xylan/chitin deacetylase (PgdA/CDA1 family)